MLPVKHFSKKQNFNVFPIQFVFKYAKKYDKYEDINSLEAARWTLFRSIFQVKFHESVISDGDEVEVSLYTIHFHK